MNDEFKDLLKSLIGVKSDKELQQGLTLLESKKKGTVEALYQYYTEIKKNPQIAEQGIAAMTETIDKLLGTQSPRYNKLQQNMTYAELGAKLNYLKRLRGECPEGYEKFAQGGKCKKCAEKETALNSFKKGCKVKQRIKKGEKGFKPDSPMISDNVQDFGDYWVRKKKFSDGTEATHEIDETGTQIFTGRRGERGVTGEFATKEEKLKADSLKRADWKKLPGKRF